MSEETENKTEVVEPVKPENGVILNKELDPLDQNPVISEKSIIFLEKTLKYHVKEKAIEKQLQYLIETQEQIKSRVERETTAVNKKIWIEMFSKTMGSYAEINKRTDTPKSTFYYWFNNDKEFRETIRTVKQNNQNDMEDILVLKAKSGNMTALVKWLEANHPKYGKKLKVETAYTGDKTLEDLIAEDEKAVDEHNKKVDELNQEKEKGQPVVHSEYPEDKKQEGEDCPVSA